MRVLVLCLVARRLAILIHQLWTPLDTFRGVGRLCLVARGTKGEGGVQPTTGPSDSPALDTSHGAGRLCLAAKGTKACPAHQLVALSDSPDPSLPEWDFSVLSLEGQRGVQPINWSLSVIHQIHLSRSGTSLSCR